MLACLGTKRIVALAPIGITTALPYPGIAYLENQAAPGWLLRTDEVCTDGFVISQSGEEDHGSRRIAMRTPESH